MLNFLSTGQLKLKCCDPKILIINLLISRTELNFMALLLMFLIFYTSLSVKYTFRLGYIFFSFFAHV